ncbi:hypothetical protein JTE90_014376 [Oedothorax gibbosus]|uniref:Exonuclease domain-containing protein n=1 Tax=Oedothorax gibbosus TaxID=931172 RepID=A0AAV6UCK3_9ARAC|nr:hypothetical protein JTE90_014376 [Oedothorax gibbosus]
MIGQGLVSKPSIVYVNNMMMLPYYAKMLWKRIFMDLCEITKKRPRQLDNVDVGNLEPNGVTRKKEDENLTKELPESKVLSSEVIQDAKIDFEKVQDEHDLENPKEAVNTPLPDAKSVKAKKKRKRQKRKGKAANVAAKEINRKTESATKLLSPLALYFILPPEEIYDKLSLYILTDQQLKMKDFPMESTENPGYICNKSCITPSTHPERHCTRCGQTFMVVDGQYSSLTSCTYHPGKISSKNGVIAAGNYFCCGGNFLAEPCTRHKFHVSAERFLGDVPFSKVRQKRQVRRGQRRSIYALDCEMSYTTAGLEVTRVAVVGADGLTVFRTDVRPEHSILDLNTQFSGVTDRDVKMATSTLEDVQAFLLTLLNADSVLVGHALHNDLFALKMIHERIVDTSVVFPHPLGGRRGSSLKFLAKKHLDLSIQDSSSGHDCIEDARTCMNLMLKEIHG